MASERAEDRLPPPRVVPSPRPTAGHASLSLYPPSRSQLHSPKSPKM
jgi:hypothetical protein